MFFTVNLKNIMKRTRAFLLIFIINLWSGLYFQSSADSKITWNADSTICSNRNLDTLVYLSTKSFKAAVCAYVELDDSQNCGINLNTLKHYYVGENKKNGSSIILPIIDETGGNNVAIAKARNGEYTYQIAYQYEWPPTDNTQGWASLSVFKNGQRIFHEQVRDFILNERNC